MTDEGKIVLAEDSLIPWLPLLTIQELKTLTYVREHPRNTAFDLALLELHTGVNPKLGLKALRNFRFVDYRTDAHSGATTLKKMPTPVSPLLMSSEAELRKAFPWGYTELLKRIHALPDRVKEYYREAPADPFLGAEGQDGSGIRELGDIIRPELGNSPIISNAEIESNAGLQEKKSQPGGPTGRIAPSPAKVTTRPKTVEETKALVLEEYKTFKPEERKPVHLLVHFETLYFQAYKVTYTLTEPSGNYFKSKELQDISKLYNLLDKSSAQVSTFLEWVFQVKTASFREGISGTGILAALVNDYRLRSSTAARPGVAHDTMDPAKWAELQRRE
jgi:hypothetical protein